MPQEHQQRLSELRQQRRALLGEAAYRRMRLAELRQQRRAMLRMADDEGGEEESSGSGGGGGKPSGKFIEFMRENGDQKVRNPDTGNMVKVKSLKGPKGKKLVQQEFQKWLKKDSPKKDSPKKDSPKKDSPKKDDSVDESNWIEKQNSLYDSPKFEKARSALTKVDRKFGDMLEERVMDADTKAEALKELDTLFRWSQEKKHPRAKREKARDALIALHKYIKN